MNSYATAEVEQQKLQEASKHLDKNKDGMVTTEEIVKSLNTQERRSQRLWEGQGETR